MCDGRTSRYTIERLEFHCVRSFDLFFVRFGSIDYSGVLYVVYVESNFFSNSKSSVKSRYSYTVLPCPEFP